MAKKRKPRAGVWVSTRGQGVWFGFGALGISLRGRRKRRTKRSKTATW